MWLLCKRFESQLVDLAEETLDERRRLRVERHVAACPRCAETLAALREIPTALREPVVEERDETFWLGQRNLIMASLDSAPKGESVVPRFLPGPAWKWATVPVVAVLLAFVGLRALVNSPAPDRRMASELTELEPETVIALLDISPSPFSEVDLLSEVQVGEGDVWTSLTAQGWDAPMAQPPAVESLSEDELETAQGLIGGLLG